MVEVFKTNVERSDHAQWLLAEIKKKFHGYTANFDLDDCDHILRIESISDAVDVSALIKLIRNLGFQAEILSDDTPVSEMLHRG
jgi:peptide subunit release factor 1 (eRF1)